MAKHLSIIVDGEGTDPNHRSHWAFAIHKPDSSFGTLLQVFVIEEVKRIFQFDLRQGVAIQSQASKGMFTLAALSLEEARTAQEIIAAEPAPRNGRDRCQDWVLDCVISLEADELLPTGTAAWLEPLVGKPASCLEKVLGARWTPASS